MISFHLASRVTTLSSPSRCFTASACCVMAASLRSKASTMRASQPDKSYAAQQPRSTKNGRKMLKMVVSPGKNRENIMVLRKKHWETWCFIMLWGRKTIKNDGLTQMETDNWCMPNEKRRFTIGRKFEHVVFYHPKILLHPTWGCVNWVGYKPLI